MVTLLGLAQKLSDPKAAAFLNKAAELPSSVDLSQSKKVGPLALLSAGFNDDIRQGLGVLMELTKAMGKMGDNGAEIPSRHP